MTTTRPIDETYADVEKMLWAICHKHQAKCGGDIDDLMGEAGLLFMEACGNHDPSQSKFSTWLYQTVNFGLISATRCRRKTKTFVDSDAVESAQERPKSKFNIGEFLAELSDDAMIVARLMLETPAELMAIADNKGGYPHNIRSTVRQALTKQWGERRVTKSFAEVKGALV